MNFILRDENAILFEAGYSCDNAIFAEFAGVKYLFTDARYAIEARSAVNKGICVIESGDLIHDLRLLIRKEKIKEIAFNPQEFTLFEFEKISKFLNVNFAQIPALSHKKRIVKSENEIEILRKAAKKGAAKFNEFAEFINKNGENLSEKELFFVAESIFKDSGKLGLSFAPIVAINENAAKAHALPTDKRLKMGDLLLLDAGVKFQNYCSDRTRTAEFSGNLNFSKEQKFSDSKRNEIYEIVKEAQNLAIKAIKPGVNAKDVDFAAREFIAKKGFGAQFFHSTGHGVGLDIHEMPYISPHSSFVLEKGMVFSVEPGIYIENEFGVRIEDVVVVTDDGCEVL